MDTGGDERAPIILERPFLCIAKAIICAKHAKIVFSIKDKKEKFSFKERILHSPALPQNAFMPKKPAAPVIRRRILETKERPNSARFQKRLSR
jgi:hypothetical protein